MNKTLKILGISLAVLVGMLVVAALVLSFTFDPNQYRDEIIHLVKEKTGRDLTIGKKIGWSFFPRLGVEAGGLELSNAPGFGKEPFAKIDAGGVRVEFMPLLHGRIAVDSVYLNGLYLNLAKNAAGHNNWEDMVAHSNNSQKPNSPAPSQPGPAKLPIEGLSVGKLDIHHANFNWRDDTAGSMLAARGLELTTGKFVSGEPFNLHLSFELTRDKNAPIKLALEGQVTAAPDALKLSKLDLKLDDSHLTGNLDIQNFASPIMRFDLALDKIDLDRYLGEQAAEPKKAAPAATPATASANAKPTELPLSLLRSLDVKGRFRIQELKAMDLHAQDALIQLVAKNGLLTIGPNQAKLYGGRYSGETVLDVRGKQPQLKMDEKLEQVQIGPLLKDMQHFDNFSGTGNIVLKLTGQGFDSDQIKKSLNGTGNIALRDGKIEGVDLAKYIEQARALYNAYNAAQGKKEVPNNQRSDATVFKSMTGNVVITNGIARNEDLVLDGPNLRATGRGSADLVREFLDYRLQVTLAGDAKSRGTTVPVTISGNFSNLSYKADLGEVLKKEATKELGKQLDKQLKKNGIDGLDSLFNKKKRQP